MNKPEIYCFKDNPAVAESFAGCLAAWIDKRSSANIAMSGGSTPNLLFKILAASYRTKIDWSKVHFYWVDERCVPPDHEQSNYGTARELLLQYLDIPSGNIHRMKGEAQPELEAKRYAEEELSLLPQENGWPLFDLILLGMGGDGHTASIFPDQMELLHDDRSCTTARHPESGQIRITLTGEVLNYARHVAFLVTGAGKAEKIKEVLGGDKVAGKHYPAGHINPIGRLTWWLDKDSATDLEDLKTRTGKIAI